MLILCFYILSCRRELTHCFLRQEQMMYMMYIALQHHIIDLFILDHYSLDFQKLFFLILTDLLYILQISPR